MRPGHTQTLVVASQNPVKIEATRRGFASMFPSRTFHLHSVSVPSGVRPQPLSDAETLQGALNRVQHAAHLVPQADYWVGIEGGVVEHQGSMEAFAWIVVSAPHLLGKSRTGTFSVPEEVATLVRQGYELATAVEEMYRQTQVKSTTGAVGVLTEGVIDRRPTLRACSGVGPRPLQTRGSEQEHLTMTQSIQGSIEAYTEGVVVACRRQDGHWLFIRRSATVRRPLRVCFPGGWIEAGESQAAAVVREMREELNADVVPVRCVWQHLFGDPPRMLWGWLAEITSEAPSPNPDEVHEMLWLTPDEAINHPDVLPYTDVFLDALLNALHQPSSASACSSSH
jgi:inosine/xanthosine triphosphatase